MISTTTVPPRIIYGATVYGANGCIKSSALGFPAYSKGYVPVIADIDEDGKMELIQGDAIHEWDAATNSWVAETYFKGTAANAKGQVAVADMGNFPLASFGGEDRAEIVVISAGQARVQTLEGTIVFGPVPIPGGGTGGPPTIADFDGDGRREFASAGGSQYVVFDLDCVAGGDPAKCGGQAKTNGVLWSQPSKDQSSNVTGSSVFDFDADGKAEAVYADECFLRIYEGATGKVLYSAARSSGTTYENPVIVDVDGDYRTEIVSSVNDYAGANGCAATDPLLPSTTFSHSHGIVILRDEQDRWAASRPVWNQHAYAVTHVGDHGEIPPTSQVKINWKDPALNNFRQNVQGDLEALGVPDLTAGGEVGAVKCQGTLATIEARVCNRGTLPMVSGTEVSFLEGTETGPVLCTAPIPKALQVSECIVVSCQADIGGKTIDVFVKVDPQGLSEECWEQNNTALYKGVACGQIPQ
ncbi:MAG: VCBS repeat-containing protein [Minicystis sp.]